MLREVREYRSWGSWFRVRDYMGSGSWAEHGDAFAPPPPPEKLHLDPEFEASKPETSNLEP